MSPTGGVRKSAAFALHGIANGVEINVQDLSDSELAASLALWEKTQALFPALAAKETAQRLTFDGAQFAGERLVKSLRQERVVRKHIRDLGAPERDTRQGAMIALRGVGPLPGSAIPPLLKCLTDAESGMRASAAVALAQIGSAAAVTVPRLRELLMDEDGFVRYSAAYALGIIGARAAKAAPALILALRDSDKNVAAAAATSLGFIGESASAAVPALTETLKSGDAAVRLACAFALGQIGRAALSGVPALTEALDDTDAGLRAAASGALGIIAMDADSHFGPLSPAERSAELLLWQKASEKMQLMNPINETDPKDFQQMRNAVYQRIETLKTPN